MMTMTFTNAPAVGSAAALLALVQGPAEPGQRGRRGLVLGQVIAVEQQPAWPQ
jgi:hypothetical protein